jgi:hypothetical protein
MTESKRKRLFLEEFEKHQKVKADGYAGFLPNGNLVDRRDFPNAIPLQYNPMLNIPHPQKL